MSTIFDIINAKAVASYWQELSNASIPYLGESLFPNQRQVGLRLDWIKGYSGAPVMLAPSAFDVKPTLRDRGGIETMSMKMPFFREAMRIGEQERQNLLTLQNAGDVLLNAAVAKIYDDAATLVRAAMVNPEVMRFELLQTGKIAISTTSESGNPVNYSYNYDPDNEWTTNNITNGVDLTTDNFATVVMSIVRKAALKGVSLTRAIVSPQLWARLVSNAKLISNIFPNNPNSMVSDNDLRTWLQAQTGVAFTIYNKVYKTFEGTDRTFMNDNTVVLLPEGNVGSTFYGTTPEEADLMSGDINADVSVVNGGVAVLTRKETSPVNVITSVSEIVLPSFEKMSAVYVMKVLGQ